MPITADLVGLGACLRTVGAVKYAFRFLMLWAAVIAGLGTAVAIGRSFDDPQVLTVSEGRRDRPTLRSSPITLPDQPEGVRPADDTRALLAEDWALVERADVEGALSVLPAMAGTYLEDPRTHDRCHQLVHELGRRAYAFYRSVAAAVDGYDGWCGGGYLHGVMEGWGRSVTLEEVMAGMESVCGQAPAPFCAHGVGHAVMQHAPNLIEAFEMCTSMPTHPWDCMVGVQMLHGQTFLRPSDADKEAFDDAGVPIGYYCEFIPDGFAAQCEREAGATWLGVAGIGDRPRVLGLCSTLPAGLAAAQRCAWGVGATVGDAVGTDVDATIEICEAGPGELTEACLGGAFAVLSNWQRDAGGAPVCPTVPQQWRDVCVKNEHNLGPRVDGAEPDHGH